MMPASERRRRSATWHATVLGAVAMCVVLGALLAPARDAAAADPRQRLVQVRAEIDRVANEYFDAQQQSRDLAQQLDQLDHDIARMRRAIAKSRARAVEAAISQYRSAPRMSLATTAATTLEAARAEVFAQQHVEREREAINTYVRAAAKLRDAQARLTAHRREAQRVERDLRKQSDALDRALTAAQQDYADLLAQQAATTTTRSSATAPSQPSDATPGATVPRNATTPTTSPKSDPTPPPPPSGTNAHHNDPFLSCVRQRESRGQYGAVNAAGYYGAYQFARRTWDVTAAHAGRPQLIGVRPDRASAWDQDELAWVLYQWQGKGPWGGHCP